MFWFSEGEFKKIETIPEGIALRAFSGVGLFETMKIERFVPIFLEDHMRRMEKSLEKMGFNIPIHNLFLPTMKLCLGTPVGVLRIFFVDGEFFAHIGEFKEKPPLKIKILEYKRNPYSFSTGMKPISYFENVFLREKLEKEGIDEGIFLSVDGFVAEGTRSNIFWIKDEKIFTPSPKTGILMGITRGKVISILKDEGFDIEEGEFPLEELMTSDEVFLTSSLMGVKEVKEIYFNGEKIIKGNEKIEIIKQLYIAEVKKYINSRYEIFITKIK